MSKRAAFCAALFLAGCGFNDVTPAMYEAAKAKCASLGGLKSFVVGNNRFITVNCRDGSHITFTMD